MMGWQKFLARGLKNCRKWRGHIKAAIIHNNFLGKICTIPMQNIEIL
jgi:hypothetical protein